MRFFEISSGLRVPVSGEEQDVLNKVMAARSLAKDDLDDREREVARQMVNRGLLQRHKTDGKTVFIPNDNLDLWRI